MRELEAAHPELIGSVRTNVGDVKCKPRSKRELIELLDMGAKMPLANIDTSLITDMEGLFRKSKRSNFAGIETWDTSNIVTMKHMFASAIYFNHDISSWDVSNVRDMSHMFEGAHRFNKPLEAWDVSSVTDMSFMFNEAERFNQPLRKWNVVSVTDMSNMFSCAEHFNQPLDGWNVSKVHSMKYMFYRAIDVAIQVAPTDLSVLITGESGVGKENFPQIIHQFSRRKHGQYIAVNCGAIPEGTIDSELFGHEKGAFTGAISDRNGYFAEANGGTIFLDEVGELPLATQARLLRVLESGEFIKVGSSKVQKTDVRIVAATNVNLTEAIAEGRFREDLYYRLNTVPIKIPPLRERGDDITLLFRKFASDFAEKYRMPAIQLTEDAKVLLLAYSWPGNVRQLKNITEQISIIETNRDITAEILRNYLPEQHVNSGLPALFGVKANTGKAFESEREILYQVLFDMRRDVTDLKKLVNTLMAERGAQSVPTAPATTAVSYYQEPQRNLVATVVPATPTIISAAKPAHPVVDDIQDTEEVVEEATLSLDEVEKEMIRKALDRHHGKRKNAAKDLNISERTLYRKIKEYGLD
jgi:surface protein